MSFWRWKRGRQENSEYYRLRLVQTRVPILWDCYLIKMGKGSHVPTHTDPAPPKHKHYRLNIVLRQTGSGGHFVCSTAILNLPRLKFFDATQPHSVTTVIEGKRLLLSFGWLWGRKSWTSFLAFASLTLIIAFAIAIGQVKIIEALTKRKEGYDHEEYLTNIERSPVAKKIKLLDMADNMRFDRLKNRKLNDRDVERLQRYIFDTHRLGG